MEKQCHFCAHNMKAIDYKNVETLKQFVDVHSRIVRRRSTGVCANHQRKLARAIKYARHMALMPFVAA